MQDILFSLLSKKTDQITPRSNFQKRRNQVFPEQQASLPHKIKLILHQRRTRVNARPFNGISTIFFHANLACPPPPPPIHCGECWIASCWRSREKNTETVCSGGEKEAWTNGARVQSSSVQPTARKVNFSIRNRPFVSCYLDREMAIFKAGTGYFQPGDTFLAKRSPHVNYVSSDCGAPRGTPDRLISMLMHRWIWGWC